jgi:negative regulator of sigma E activity
MTSDRDNFEFALSQYADGTLNELEKRVVEERLLTDAEGRLLVSDFARIDLMLRNSRELPAMDFDAFAGRISAAIESEEAPVAAPIRLHLYRWAGGLAAAAAVAIAAFVGLRPHSPAPGQLAQPTEIVAKGSAVIAGPSVETASAAPAIKIGVGPSDILAKRGDTLSLGEEAIAPRPPKVVIGSAASPNTGDVRPY